MWNNKVHFMGRTNMFEYNKLKSSKYSNKAVRIRNLHKLNLISGLMLDQANFLLLPWQSQKILLGWKMVQIDQRPYF
jgi:hypothetical protein